MFKAIGNLLHKTPWWAMILVGISTLAVLVMFAVPFHIIRLVDSGHNPAERHAIQREIGLTVGDKALNLAKGVVTTIQERNTDPERQRELTRALAEIERARSELLRARTNGDDWAQDSARDAAESAMEAAQDAAEAALEAAVEARESVEEVRAEALERLRDKGLDTSVARSSLDELVAGARDKEHAARAALATLRAMQHEAPGPGLTIRMGEPTPPVDLPPTLKDTIHAQVGGDVWRAAIGSALIVFFIPVFLVLLISKFFIGRSRHALALAERKTQEAERSDVSRQVTEARLQTLQAQVEPHFLYNTLANVQALNEVDPPAANQMVGHLIQYLRASLPKMRESSSTVGQELELVRAYLNILQMRMGERLAFSISAPDDLLTCAFPPMMLPSLVENAVKHGLEPQRDGGRIDIVVERVHDTGSPYLRVAVQDTGKGLSDQASQTNGVGLTNLRERLAALYGSSARFWITANAPTGVVATIEVPLQPAGALQATPPEATPHSGPAMANSAAPATPRTGWRRLWWATSQTHSFWARLLARTFLVMVLILGGLLVAGFIGLLTGWLPVQVGDLQLDGVEGFAIGSVGLLIGFGVAALAIAFVLAVVYGLGFLFAALAIFIPVVILIAVSPVLAPLILMALGLWWIITRRRA